MKSNKSSSSSFFQKSLDEEVKKNIQRYKCQDIKHEDCMDSKKYTNVQISDIAERCRVPIRGRSRSEICHDIDIRHLLDVYGFAREKRDVYRDVIPERYKILFVSNKKGDGCCF